MSDAYRRLCEFVDRKMQMSHIYQPVMLQVLLSHGGQASIRRIAQAFLGHDESQLDYYEQVVKNMPGRVLASHGVVERDGDTYALGPGLSGVSEDERADLIRRCDEAVERFKEKRGSAIWQHRRPGLGVIPGRVRYDTLKRAGFRCELCGVSADERALDVDHIVPRKHGGSDDPENLQAFHDASVNDWNAIDDLAPLAGGPALCLKTLHLYFQNEILPVYSQQHIRHFLRLLDGPEAGDRSLGAVRLNRALLAKATRPWSPGVDCVRNHRRLSKNIEYPLHRRQRIPRGWQLFSRTFRSLALMLRADRAKATTSAISSGRRAHLCAPTSNGFLTQLHYRQRARCVCRLPPVTCSSSQC